MIFDKDNFPILPESWQRVFVNDASQNLSVTHKVQTKNYNSSGILPIIDQGVQLIGGYTNDDISVTDQMPVVIFGDHTRILKYIDFPFAAGADGIKVLAPKEFYLPQIFFRFLQSIKLPNRGYSRHFQFLRNSELPLPPINEQIRIADKLDAVLARVDACRDRLDRIPVILKRFRQSVLAAATSGRLTEEWRAECAPQMQLVSETDNKARDSAQLLHAVTVASLARWREVRLADIADVQGGITKDAKKQSPTDEAVSYLRVANVQRGHLDLDEVKTIRVPAEKLAGLLLEPGDILFNEGGDIDKLGRGWIWEGQIERCSFQNHVFRARLYDKSNQPKYISWWGNFRGLNYFLRGGKQTTNLASINKSMLGNLPISLPPPDEQAEIIRRVESLFALADRLEARYTSARAQVEKLTPSLLAKAFRGELVPQDPNDEPASVLLERIRAQRGADPAIKPKRGRGIAANPKA